MSGRLQRWLPSAVLAAMAGLLALNAPLSDGLIIGGDDGFELGKAQVLHRAPELAGRLHNDQPWLHTMVVAAAFSILGENAAIPRLLSLACMAGLVMAVWRVAFGPAAALECVLFVLYLFSSREAAILSTSAMLEPVALGLSVMAMACVFSTGTPARVWQGALAGLVMSLAVWTKLTALLVGPAWVFLLFTQERRGSLAAMAGAMFAGFAAGTAVVLAISPPTSVDQLWLSHSRAADAIPAGGEREAYAFALKDVFHEWTVALPLALGLVRPFLNRGWPVRTSMLGLVWLATEFAVFVPHLPWWGYYALHFHVPAALLAAAGAGWMLRRAWAGLFEAGAPAGGPVRRWRPSAGTATSVHALVAAAIIAGWGGIRLPAFCKELADVHTRETAGDNVFVPLVRRYSD